MALLVTLPVAAPVRLGSVGFRSTRSDLRDKDTRHFDVFTRTPLQARLDNVNKVEDNSAKLPVYGFSE